MARQKKDGRFINYFIDRGIYDRLRAYAEEKGQSMTTAIERILDANLPQMKTLPPHVGDAIYCGSCHLLTEDSCCPSCGSSLRVPLAGDYCFLTEKEVIWSNALEELLKDNGIPYVTRTALGAGLTSKLGMVSERIRFYVPFIHHQRAKLLDEEFFSAKFEEE